MLICDIDGCIFDNQHRKHLIPSDKSDTHAWSQFNKGCLEDLPIMERIEFVKHLAVMAEEEQHKKITFVTARGESARHETTRQLMRFFSHFNYQLLMRPMNDQRCSIDFKRSVFHQLSNNMNEHSLIIDDNPGVISMVKINFPHINRLLVKSFDCTVTEVR